MREPRERVARSLLSVALAALLGVAAGCGRRAPLEAPRSRYASAEQVELNFRDKPFILGDSDTIAKVRPLGWPGDRWLELPFWFGINVLVPGVQAPREGGYYVISEAKLEKPLDAPGEWMIEAGSALIKQETVFVTTRTHYLNTGKILPTIVQYMGKRTFVRGDGKTVEVPVVREVSYPMKWTLEGRTPASYARYRIE
jgi:predicted small lipoprotein YifL